jgi:acetyl esterase/lipase
MRRPVVLTVLVVLFSGRAMAASYSWTGTIGDHWSNPLNWSPPTVPAASDDLTFPATSPHRDITFDMPSGTSVGSMTFLGDYRFTGNGMSIDGAVDVNGRTLSFASPDGTLLNGPLNGTGTVDAGSPGSSFIGGGSFSGAIEGYAYVAGVYPNATFRGPWLTGIGTLGSVTAGELSPGRWKPGAAGDPHDAWWMYSGPLTITSHYAIDIQPEGNLEEVFVTGPVSIAGTLTVTIAGLWPPSDGMRFPIIDNDGSDPVQGTFEGLPEGATINAGNYTFWISYHGGDGNDVVLTAGIPGAKTWIGSNSDQWSDPGNWQPQGVPEAGEPLLFPPCCYAREQSTNDLPAGFNPGTLTFNRNYTISGNLLTLTNDLEFVNAGFTGSLVCNAPLRLGNSIRIDQAQSSVFNGSIDMNGNTLTVTSLEARFLGPIEGNGAISAPGNGISLESSGSFNGTISGVVNVVGSYPNAAVNGPRVSGEGTIGAVTAGTVSPGSWTPGNDAEAGGPPHQTATLKTGTLSISAKYIADIDPANGLSDRVDVTGTVSLGGTLNLFFINPPSPGQSWTLIENDGTDSVNGAFSGLPEGATFSNGYGTKQTLRITYQGGDGNDVVLSTVGAPAMAATTTTIAQDRDTTEWHQPVTFTATVTSANAVATGVVSFRDGSATLGSVPLQNGTATLNTTALGLGDHSVTASYAGNDSLSASSSAPLVHHVVKGNPHLTITSSMAHPAYGDRIPFVISVAPGAGSPGTPGGSVSLTLDHQPAGTAPLAGGKVTINVPLIAAGPHVAEVSYSGDAAFSAARSAASLTVGKAVTTVTVDSPVNPSPAGVAVTFNVQVVAVAHPSMTLDGTVYASRDGRIVAQAPLAGGSAALNVGALPGGDHELTISYAGNGDFERGDKTLTQRVTAPALSVANATLAAGSESRSDAIQVTLSAASAGVVSVDYRTVDGSAIAGADYIAAQGLLTFQPGQTSAMIPIHILGNADASQQSLAMELENPNGASIVAPRATVTIARDARPTYRTPVAYSYATIDGVPLRVTFYAPANGDGPWPLIVWIPGNSTYDAAGDTAAVVRETARGYAVASVAYRPASAAPFPAQLDDLLVAIEWLRTNASTLNVDPKRIAAWGTGAGGHLAALVGTRGAVQAVIDWSGIADPATLQADALGCSTIDWNAPTSPTALLIGCSPNDCPDSAAAAAPARYARRGNPPMLLMHGGTDCFISPAQSENLYGALTHAGVDATLRTVDGIDHDSPFWSSAAAFAEVESFLERSLKPSEARGRAVRH